MDSPLEYGYGNKHTAAIKKTKHIAITNTPHQTNEEGISPKNFRTFSE